MKFTKDDYTWFISCCYGMVLVFMETKRWSIVKNKERNPGVVLLLLLLVVMNLLLLLLQAGL